MKNNKKTNNRKRFIPLFLVIILIIIIIVFITIPQKTSSGTNSKNFLANLGIYTKEVPAIEIKSDDFDNNKSGSYKVTKSAKWTSDKKARITFNIDSVLKTGDNKKDVLLVMDISGSMSGSKLDKAKSDAKELANTLLSDNENRMGVITFESKGVIGKPLTNNKDELTSYIDSLVTIGATNYNDALLKVGEILAQYSKSNKDFIVLFVTDGYPCEDTPNEIATYEILKEKYPYLVINGIQYEMGAEITNEIKNISDAQWSADQTTLGNALLEAAVAPETYEEFMLTDYIDEDYFKIESVDDIKTSRGNVTLDGNKVTWDFGDNSFITGSSATMTIDLTLKGNFEDASAYFPTNEKEEIAAKLDKENLSKTSKDTPVLKSAYNVIYDSNAPSDCTTTDLPNETHYVFDTVTKTNEKPSCNGYQFKGWEITNENVEIISDDSFVMPEEDVTLKATWTRQNIDKTMDGTVNGKATLYKTVERDAKKDMHAKKYTGNGSDNYENNVYYYTYEAQNNNVKFANFCWKMVRTTDTGGVKLLYNGTPNASGQCDGESGVDYQGQTVKASVAVSKYNENYNSPAYVGYMYNTVYTYNNANISDGANILSYITTYNSATIGDTITYNNNTYTITNSDGSTPSYQRLNNLSKDDLLGKYVCFSSSASCSNPSYIIGNMWSSYYGLNLSNGKLKDDYKIVLGKSYEGNELKETEEISATDWFNSHYDETNSNSKYDLYTGYYVCTNSDGTNEYDKSTCTNVSKVTSDSYNSISYTNKSFANSVTWNGTSYTLNNSTIGPDKSHHYYCEDGSSTCQNVRYMYYNNYYIELTNGKKIEDAINEMLYNDDVNTNDSTLKTATDTWYANNMTEYTQYLEDTVYCNDRSIDDKGGWDPNLGELNSQMYFAPLLRYAEMETNNFIMNGDLTCKNHNDSFTVGTENGNGKLTYPVGFLNSDETILAYKDLFIGKSVNELESIMMDLYQGNSYSYLNNQLYYWLGSPAAFDHSGAYAFTVDFGVPGYDNVNYVHGVRPVVSLASGIGYSDGNGTVEAPYVVELDGD